MGQEHLTSLKRSDLQRLASETGLAYSDLIIGGALNGALRNAATPHSVKSLVDARPIAAALALILLLSSYLVSVLTRSQRPTGGLRQYGFRFGPFQARQGHEWLNGALSPRTPK